MFNVPNRIKQPALCCMYCGKSYKKRTNLNNHIVVCEIVDKAKKDGNINDDEIDEVPSQKKMYKMMLMIIKKQNALEEKLSEVYKFAINKQKKINICEWLNTNKEPAICFNRMHEKIEVTTDDVKYLMENSFVDTLSHIFSKGLYYDNSSAIVAFAEKPNTFYIYNSTQKWREMNKEDLISFLNRIHHKLYCLFIDYKKFNADKRESDGRLEDLFTKTTSKITNFDFNQDVGLVNKIKLNMYNNMKREMRPIVEFEF